MLSDVVGVHRERYGLPITVAVTKTVQGGKITYMGVIRPRQPEGAFPASENLCVWVSGTGTALIADAALCSALGYKPQEIAGKPCDTLADSDSLSKLVNKVLAKGRGRGVTRADLRLVPKFRGASQVPVQAHAVLVGSPRFPVVIVSMKVGPEPASCSFGYRRCWTACAMLGSTGKRA